MYNPIFEEYERIIEMTSQYILSAVKRENFGKRATKRYRRENLVPAEIYGTSKDNQSVLVNSFELDNQTKDPQFYSNVIDLSVDDKKVEAEQEAIKDITKGMKETESGIKYKISKKGTGDNAKTNDLLSVHYSLQLIDGSEIDSSFTRGAPIEFTCGVGQVIKGWDEAMQLLNKGSKARLVIPSELGYGAMGAGNGVIPPNATLIFDVELVDIK